METKLLKPNTFIIGAPKCGTTALAHYLSEHNQVYFSKPKEPFFWSDDIPKTKHELRPRDLNDYLSLFKQADINQHKIIAEGSTRYLRSQVAVKKIIEFNTNAKFIAMLRNPIEVAQAFHMEQRYVLHEDEPNFDKAWKLQADRERGLSMPPNSAGADYVLYRKVASYSTQIKRLLEIVPEDQRLIIIFDDFKQNPRAVYSEVLGFLGLDDDGRTEFPKVNSSHGQRFPLLAKILLYPPEPLVEPMRKFRRFVLNNEALPISLLKSFLNKKQEREPVDKNTMTSMKKYFEQDVNELSTLLKKDLRHWINK